jgi:hypothetical protein
MARQGAPECGGSPGSSPTARRARSPGSRMPRAPTGGGSLQRISQRRRYSAGVDLGKKQGKRKGECGGKEIENQIEMAMGTRNPSTRRVLPDKEVGMESYFYPRAHKWAISCTHRVSGCGYIPPIPAYPRVKYTHQQYVINEQGSPCFITLLIG